MATKVEEITETIAYLEANNVHGMFCKSLIHLRVALIRARI